MKSYYEILEVPNHASAAEIRSAYLGLAREYHPDRVPEHLTKLRADAEAKLKLVNEAWSVLGDTGRRRKYDLQLVKPNARSAGHDQASAKAGATASPKIRIFNLLRNSTDTARWVLVVAVGMVVLLAVGEFIIARRAVTQPVDPDNGDVVSRTIEPPRDARIIHYDAPSRHVQTWRPAGGAGIDVQLVSVALATNETQVCFRVRAGQHSDLLLYEPPGGTGRTRSVRGKKVAVDRDLKELYLVDNSGTKYYSTSGLVGGQQANFNIFNFTRRINLPPREEITLVAQFPRLEGSASSIDFFSPAVSQWQPEWRWPAINLK
jgi:hypothetical protein